MSALMRLLLGGLCGALLTVGGVGAAFAVTIDFDGLPAGTFVDDQFAGVNISGVTFDPSHPDAAILFDSQGGSANDTDLQGPAWSGGNIASEVLGNLLILPQNVDDANSDGLVDVPNDSGKGPTPGGFLVFGFDTPITDFGLDLVDLEAGESLLISFLSDGDVVGSLSDADLAAMDGSIAYGNNSANRIAPISAAMFNAASFDQVQIHLFGSGAIDNVDFSPVSVPEAGTAALLGVGILGLALRQSQR